MAADGSLPERIDEKSDISVPVFRELYESGLIEAADASHLSGNAYLQPRITLAGRHYLQEMEEAAQQPARDWKSILSTAAKWLLLTLLAGGILKFVFG